MSKTNKENAAIYFYDGFLGCSFPKDAAHETKKFFEYSKEFIFKYSSFSDEEKYAHYADLQSYLRSPTQTIQVSEFAQRYIERPEDKDAYSNFMREKNFSTNSIHKDTINIKEHLKVRKLRFTSSIKLYGPSDKMDNLVTFEKISGPRDMYGNTPEWTKIIIRDKLSGTE